MYFLRRLLILLNSFFLFFGLELVRKNKSFWWIVLLVLVSYLIITIWYLNKKKLSKSFSQLLVLPSLLVLSVFSFSLFISNDLFFHLFLLLVSVVLFYYFNQILLFSYYPFKYQPYILENLSFYLSLGIFFLWAVVGFGGVILLKIPLWLVLIGVGFIASLLIWQLFGISKFSFKDSKIFIISLVIILMELTGSLVFLPLSYYVNALVLSVFFYLTVSLSRLYLSANLNKQQVKNYLLISLLILIITLGTAQWI